MSNSRTGGTERFPWLPADIAVTSHDFDGDQVYLFIGPMLTSQLAWTDEILSSEEHDRASRFVFDLHRNRFRFRRAALRKILAHWLSVDPTDLRLTANAWGKLFLNTRSRSDSPMFNLSHSGDAIAIATSNRSEIGIDIELHRPLPEINSMARMIMHAQEWQQWEHLSTAARSDWFFNLWSIKEAILKCVGCGLAIEPASFAVNPAQTIKPTNSADSLQTLSPPQRIQLIDPNQKPWTIEVCLFQSFPGFSSAIARRIEEET